jgi:hypothetical protein
LTAIIDAILEADRTSPPKQRHTARRSSHALFLPRRRTMLSASPSCRKSRRAIVPPQRRFER